MSNDPWSWVDQQPPVAPLSGATIQPSQATPAQIQVQPKEPGIMDMVTPMVTGRAINKGADALEKSVTSDPNSLTGGLYNSLFGTKSAVEAAATPVADLSTYSAAAQPMIGGGLTASAPLGASYAIAPEAAALGTEAALGSGLAAGTGAAGLTAGAGSALGAVGAGAAEAGMLASMGPIGWAALGLMGAKALKIF